jgi:RimJ/RimL family protein N-acetyltransferase
VEVARSWPGTTSIGLSASVRSPEAIRLYEAQGFRRWGVEPGALLLDGCAYDEVHMVALFESRP